MSAQVVFLVDVNQKQTEGAESSQSFVNNVCLACLRLLHFLSSKLDKKVSRKPNEPYLVKWGFKFFNTKSAVSKIEKHQLRDFKLKYFEDFENEVKKRLIKVTDNEKILKKTNASACLTKALTELLSDFPWEKPDITSPVRGRKTETFTSSTNIVILLTRCPKNASGMKQFTGKQVPDDEVFLDSILPPALFQQFCHVSRLSLYWLDTQPLITVDIQKCVDTNIVKIAEDALVKCGGKLIPLDALVRCQNPYLSHMSGLVEHKQNPNRKCNESDGQKTREPEENTEKILWDNCLLPFTSCLDFYLNMSSYNAVTEATSTVSAQLYVNSTDTIQINMKPATYKKYQQNEPTLTVSSKLPVEVDLEKVSADNLILSLETVPMFPTSNVQLHIYGVVERNLVLPDLFSSSCCYVCTEVIGSINTTGQVSRTFEKLLTDLVKSSSLLVLQCKSSPHLYMLEPLTVTMATIKAVNAGMALQVEKCLLKNTVDSRCTSDVVKLETDRVKCDVLIQRLVKANKHTSCTSAETCNIVKTRAASQFDGRLLDRWHIPGCRSALTSLIDKLNDRISDLSFLSDTETTALKELQKAYKKKPPGFQPTPTPTESRPSLGGAGLDNSLVDEVGCKPDSGGKQVRKSGRVSISTRTDMIINKSKEVVKERGQVEKDGGKVDDAKSDRTVPDSVAGLDFKNTEELKEYLTSIYRRVVTGEVIGLESNIQTMVTIVLHYMKQVHSTEPEKAAIQLLDDSVIVSAQKLRELYSSRSEEEYKAEKLTEYQVQVLLRLEMASTLINKDQSIGEEEVNDQVVGLLRTLSFISEAGFLAKFMQNCLLYNYMHTIPKTLANIYDELMQPLPDALAEIISPDNSMDETLDESVMSNLGAGEGGPPSARTRSRGSVGPASNQPGSNASLNEEITLTRKRGRKLVHHPSLADFGPKRQIVVDVAKSKTSKQYKTDKNEKKKKKAKDKIRKSLFDRAGAASGGVVRGGVKLERRQSVAVMERSHRTPKKSKSKLCLKSPVNRFLSPVRKMVTETPCHKQVSQALWHRQDDQRRLSDVTSTETDIVAESPVKSVQCQDYRKKDTPTKGKRAKAILRRSFYSAGPVNRTRNLTKYFQLADRIAGRQKHPSGGKGLPKLLTFNIAADFKSPEKNSSFLMSQFMTSPSPAKTTPRKSVMTPSKLLESPSMNTRSRGGSAFKFREMSSPVNQKSMSPEILVADSTTKQPSRTEHRTPTKSPVCGAVVSGLDSPSQNTRLKTMSATPTRRSVRAALFAKSPAANRYQSPQARSGTPRTLVHRFNSPAKMDSDGFLSPGKPSSIQSPRAQKQVLRENTDFRQDQILETRKPVCSSNLFGSMSERTLSSPISSRNGPRGNSSNQNVGEKGKTVKTLDFSSATSSFMSPRKRSEVNNRNSELNTSFSGQSFNFIQTAQIPEKTCAKSELDQKTPSPKKKTVTKTPDSFDKWHRRKPRPSNSPFVSKKQTAAFPGQSRTPSKVPSFDVDDEVSFKVGSEQELERMSREPAFLSPKSKQKSVMERVAYSQPDLINFSGLDTNTESETRVKAMSALRKKRSLLMSPEKLLSPSKRRRTCESDTDMRCNSITSSQEVTGLGSQGFNYVGSFSELSQRSSVGSQDYFSTNDEVFMSNRESINVNDGDSQETDMDSVFASSTSVGEYGRICTNESKSSAGFSPRLKGIPRVSSNVNRKLEERSDSPIFGHSRLVERKRHESGGGSAKKSADSKENSASPHCIRSPSGKMYSPAVSAKSLMHLINSPLVSSVKKDTDGLEPESPRRGERSRRSLKMQN